MKTKLFVATPCYGGMVNVKYMESVINLTSMCNHFGIELNFYNIPFESLIPRARNMSVTRFMTSDYTHLMFIDADISFDARSVLKMLKEDKEIICGAYPKKVLDFEMIKKHGSDCQDIKELTQVAGKYAVNFIPEKIPSETGVIECLDGATGFMIIRRDVIEKMIDRYPETEYMNDINAYKIEGAKYYDLFQSKVIDGRYLSEDYGFCRLWQKMGKTVHVDLTVKLTHIGNFPYHGDPVKSLEFKNRA
jgi:hypothetical protein